MVAHVITDSFSLEIMQEYWPASFMAAFLIWSTEEVWYEKQESVSVHDKLA